jgi:hypothetical protein
MRPSILAVFILVSSVVGSAAEETGAPCAPIESVPGVKIRPSECKESVRSTARPPAAPGAYVGTSQPGFLKFGNTEIRFGGRVRVEGGYEQP